MTTKQAQVLRDEWTAKGSPPCDHPYRTQERIDGQGTGDFVCTTCGDYK
jgi:hypothetical protein